MQILHPFAGSVTRDAEEISDPDRCRPDHCPQCEAQQPLLGHGFNQRPLVDPPFGGVIRVRRYLCRLCMRTVSLLPEFALPYLRFGIPVIALFLIARLLYGRAMPEHRAGGIGSHRGGLSHRLHRPAHSRAAADPPAVVQLVATPSSS